LNGNEADWDEFDLPELDDDAQAALERVKQEARNEALREAAEATQEVSGIKPFSSVAHVKSIISKSILALITEDQSDG
jgi:hypothetical protein